MGLHAGPAKAARRSRFRQLLRGSHSDDCSSRDGRPGAGAISRKDSTMYPVIRRTILAAAFGLMGSAAFAQTPPPLPPAAQPTPMPMPLAAQPVTPAPLMTAAPAPYATPTYGGCSTECAPTATSKRLAGRIVSPFTIGEGCANPVSCGNFASERTFLFGSCRQFFNPGNKCGHSWGLHGCATSPLGTGGLGNHNSCEYGTHLNR